MKILYIHQYFNTPESGGPLRSWHFSNALVEAGIDVEVITGGNCNKYYSEKINGINIHYLPVTYQQNFSTLRRIKSFLQFVLYAIKQSRKINTNLVYASSTPLTVGLIALYLKLSKQKPYIFEVRDLWPEAPIQLGFIKNSLLKKILISLEKKIYSNAIGLVALSDPIAKHISSIVPGKPMTVLTNMSDTDFFRQKDDKLNLEKDPSVKLVITYFGSVGIANNLNTLLNLADLFQQKKNTNVLFIIAGKGSELNHLKKLVTDKELRNIKFIPYQNRSGLRRLLNVTDISYLSFREEPVLKTGSPNKLFDSLAAGVPCISNIKGWWVEKLEKDGCVLYFPPGNNQELYQHLNFFIDNPDALSQAKKKAAETAKVRFDKKIIVKEFISFVKKLSNHK